MGAQRHAGASDQGRLREHNEDRWCAHDDLGLYVVIEAMNKDFLKRHFGSGKGNLYEGYLQDVNGRLEQDNGEDLTQADLRALHAACAIVDPLSGLFMTKRALTRVALASVLYR